MGTKLIDVKEIGDTKRIATMEIEWNETRKSVHQPKCVRGNPKVSIICVAYKQPDSLRYVMYCFKSQTYQNFEFIVVHDGPDEEMRKVVEAMQDKRFKFTCSPKRMNDWGHSNKHIGVKAATGDYIGFTNDDNFYCPKYLEWMLHTVTIPRAAFVYCNMVHSHRGWRPQITLPRVGEIDSGGWIAKAELVKAVPWEGTDHLADGRYVEKMLSQGGIKVVKEDAFLFMHC